MVYEVLAIETLFEVTNIVHWGLGTDDEITTLFHFPALTSLELDFWSAVDANEGIAINYFHDFFSTEVKTQSAWQYNTN